MKFVCVRRGVAVPRQGHAGGNVVSRQDGAVVARQRQAEIDDLDAVPAFLQPDVGRLDVPVDQPALVGLGQSLRDFLADPQDLLGGQFALAVEAVFQRLAQQELHGQVGHAAVLAHLVNGDDVVVLDRGGGLRLAVEALAIHFQGGLGLLHCLQGDLALQRDVFGLEDQPHRPRAEQLEHAIVAQPAHLAGTLRRAEKIEIALQRPCPSTRSSRGRYMSP